MEPLRKTCILCSIKHLGQAYILGRETRLGYQEHYWIALAHMAEAEAELLDEQPQMAEEVRLQRKSWESDPSYRPPFEKIIKELACLAGADIDTFLLSEHKEILWP